MRHLKWLVPTLVLVAVAIGGWVWYQNTPHTAEQQFAFAEKLDKQVRADATLKGAPTVRPQAEGVIVEYHRVGDKYGKSEKAAEGLRRIVQVQREVLTDDAAALKTLDELIAQYPTEELAGAALLEQAKIFRQQAEAAGAKGDSKALTDRYKDALAKLEEYRKKFEKGKQADAALIEMGRIWQEGIKDPRINAIRIFEQFLKDYPTSEHVPEAMFRLAQMMEEIKEFKKALALYGDLLEKYASSPWASKALFARGKLLAREMDQPEKAAEDFKKLRTEHPDSPLAGAAAGEEKSAQRQAAQRQHDDYGKRRYGGSMPVDTTADKPVPPPELLRQFAEQKLDAERYHLWLDLYPAQHRMVVSGTLEFVNRGESKKELLFMLSHSLMVSRVSVNGLPVVSEQPGDAWKLTLLTPLAKDAKATVEFTYAGYFDGAAWGDPKAKPSGTSNPQFVLGEYGYALAGAMWYPTTIIGDVFTTTLHITTPPGSEAVANGAQALRRPGTGSTRGEFVYRTTRPIFGLYFAYGPYAVRQQKVGAIEYWTYFKPANAAKSELYVKTVADILGFYSDTFVPFPYEKMAILEAPLPPFLGGVGPASMMFLNETWMVRPDAPTNLLAHELAHQWFGNLVPVSIATPGYSQWLSEGFATYCDALYGEKTNGHQQFVEHMQTYAQTYFQLKLQRFKDLPIKDSFDMMQPMYRPVVYEKGAIVLHSLRKVLGDAKFFPLVRKFTQTYQDKSCTVDDFRRMAADAYGSDLSWFFDQWVDRTVYARWVIEDVRSEPAGTGATAARKVRVTIRQPEELVKMPVDVSFFGEKGERFVAENQMLDQKEQTVEAVVPFEPVKVVLDEEFWVLHHLGKGNTWPVEAAAKGK